MIRPTAAELLRGRIMRAPDHPPADPPADPSPSDPAPSDPPADPPADPADPPADDKPQDPPADPPADDNGSLVGSAKADDDKGGDGDGDGADDGKTDTVPETYELKPLTIGEGDDAQEIEIDAKLLTDVTPQLKEAGVTQAQIEKLAPLVVSIEKRIAEAQAEGFAEVKADWVKQVKDDPEIGGKNLPTTLATIGKALDYLGEKSEIKEVDGKPVEQNEFRRFLNETGVGNHPAFVRMFNKIGQAVGEDGVLPRGDKAVVTQKDRLETLYPDDVPKSKSGE